MGLRTLKEAKIRLKHQLSLIRGLCDGVRAQLDTGWQPPAGRAAPPGGRLGHCTLTSPPGLGHHQSSFGSLKRTNSVARWYKMTRSIMVVIMPFIKIGQLSQHLASIGGESARVLAVSRTLHIFHSVLSRPAVSDLTKLNRRWFGPIMFLRAQAKGICWLPLCLSDFPPWIFYPCGTSRGNGALRFSAVTVHQRRERWKAQRVVSHEPARSWTGLLDRSQGWHKELCHIPVLYWTAKIFISLESGNELSWSFRLLASERGA